MDRQELINKAVAGASIYSDKNFKGDFYRACEHVRQLLIGAYTLYRAGQFSSSTFLSITALEERAKAEIAIYRKSDGEAGQELKRSNDPLYNHKAKHVIALPPTILIGSKLHPYISAKRVEEIINMASSGKLVELRESCLYMKTDGAGLKCPSELVDRAQARELLLVALEAVRDGLVGYTSDAYDAEDRMEKMFDRVAKS